MPSAELFCRPNIFPEAAAYGFEGAFEFVGADSGYRFEGTAGGLIEFFVQPGQRVLAGGGDGDDQGAPVLRVVAAGQEPGFLDPVQHGGHGPGGDAEHGRQVFRGQRAHPVQVAKGCHFAGRQVELARVHVAELLGAQHQFTQRYCGSPQGASRFTAGDDRHWHCQSRFLLDVRDS